MTTQSLSYPTMAARLVELGMLPPERAESQLAGLGEWRDQEFDREDVPDVLVELGVAVSVPGEDVDSLVDTYRRILEGAVACAGSSTVTDVELDGDALRFLLDGEPRRWRVEHYSDRHVDHLGLFEHFSELNPGGDDPRVFYVIGQTEPGMDSFYVLATPRQAQALRAEFDLDLANESDDPAAG